ncbi:MAG: DoxX family membrane protein [Gemmatimonadales bacterium]
MSLPPKLDPIDVRITSWMARHGITLTRIALGVVFLWFGVIKFVPTWSPAAELATRTIDRLSFGLVAPSVSLPLLAAWESLIGLGLLTGRYLRTTLFLLFLQMPGTLMPLVLFPHEAFRAFPYAPTLEGQYIIKNLVLIGAAIVVGATVRGGHLRASPGAEAELRAT